MVLIDDLASEPDDDERKSKRADQLTDISGLFKSRIDRELALISKMQSVILPEVKIWSAALDSASYITRSWDKAQINRTIEGMTSFHSNLSYESKLNQVSQAAASLGVIAGRDYANSINKSLLDSQLSIQSQIEICKSALESVFSNQRYNQDILANNASALQQAFNATGLTRDFLQESYTKVIQTISKSVFPAQDLMFESVRRVLENESLTLRTAAQLSSQGVLKDFLSNTQAMFDSNYFSLQSDLIQNAIAPFMRQWAWLVCDAKLVSVDIYHDNSHLMYAEYDRETVTELLTARFAIEATESDVSINSSGSLEQPNDLFECSGEHESHHADYAGETVLNPKDNTNTNKALLQYLDEARNSGAFDEDVWDQIETNARCAEKIVREIYGDMMHIALSLSIEIAVLCVKNNHISAEEYRALHEKEWSRLRKLLPKPEDGRPQGSGLFKNTDDFLTALKDVLEKAHKKPTQIVALHALRQHPLCQGQTTDKPTQDQTKTLRNWLTKCGMTYKDALERFWKPARKGK